MSEPSIHAIRGLVALGFFFLFFCFKLIKVIFSYFFFAGKANQAKNLILNIAALGQNKHKYIFLDSKSLSKSSTL